MGTNWASGDFEGFSGLITDNTWTLLGHNVISAVINSKQQLTQYHGPMSATPLDRWQLRNCYVVGAIPKWDGHPYGRRLMFVDDETFAINMTLVFDRTDALFKIMLIVHERPDDVSDPEPSQSLPRWKSSIAINLRDGTGTIGRAMSATEFVDMTPSQVKQIFSISNLTSGC